MIGKTRPTHCSKRLRVCICPSGSPEGIVRTRTLSPIFMAFFVGSQLPPNVLEIVETFFSGEPLGSEHGPFGEAAAGLGVVAEVDAVGGGFEDDLVQAHDLALAEGSDFQIFVRSTRFAHQALDRNCRAGGSVLLVRVVALENLAGVIV